MTMRAAATFGQGRDGAGLFVEGGTGIVLAPGRAPFPLTVERMSPTSAPSSNDERARAGRRIIAVAAVLIAVPLIGLSAPRVYAGARARGWPTVEGTIRDQYFTDDRVDRRSGGDASRLHVQYDYAYGGDAYSGSRITPTALWVRSTEASRRTYAIGATVAVHVDPDDPKRAALDVGLPWGAIVSALAGVAAFGWGSWMGFTQRAAADDGDEADVAARAS